MPIVFERFIAKEYPELEDRFDIVYTSIFRSDLSAYGCKKSEAISSYFFRMPRGSAVIVLGGETLASPLALLYTHTVRNASAARLLRRVFRRAGPRFSSKVAQILCGVPFEFPYTPPPVKIGDGVRVLYNSVGGSVPVSGPCREEILGRLSEAAYISVRDRRIKEEQAKIGQKILLAPDSVSSVRSLFDDEYILERVSEPVRKMADIDYYVFQASPHKCKDDPFNIAAHLVAASERSQRPFILLPIGYASGHDDASLLRQVGRKSNFQVLEGLNIWEILWVIRCSRGYFGTSLHGAITAMAYALPHFAVGHVPKLKAYLAEWSDAPFNSAWDVSQIPSLMDVLREDHTRQLQNAAFISSDGALRNMHNIVAKL